MRPALLALLFGVDLIPVDLADPSPPKAAVIERLAWFIERYEGAPSGNLIYVGQRGAVRGPGGYAKWATDAQARAALRRDLGLKLGRGMSVAEVLAVWCDPAPCNYARRAGELGFDIDARWE